jgi:hypothetical protein
MTEHSLHAEIKEHYSAKGGQVEVQIDEFVVDVVKNGVLIEIQTKNLSAIKKKLKKLLATHQVRLVYPIAKVKWIVYVTSEGEFIKKRKSPKKGKIVDLFFEMVHSPQLVNHKNFSFEVLLIEEEELRCKDGKGSWRKRGISVKDRRLLKVFDRVVFRDKTDFLKILPDNLGECFTNKSLAKKMDVNIRLAQKITYCLRKMNTITIDGKKKRELQFRVLKESSN